MWFKGSQRTPCPSYAVPKNYSKPSVAGASILSSTHGLLSWETGTPICSSSPDRTRYLFTNEPTLYSFAVLGVKKATLSAIATLFAEHLKLSLTQEDIPTYVIDRLVAEYRNLSLAGTVNRSVLGSMNDLANLLEHYVQDAGGSGACDVRQINQQLNRTPHKPLGWKFAIDVLHERLLGAFAVPGRPRSRVFLN